MRIFHGVKVSINGPMDQAIKEISWEERNTDMGNTSGRIAVTIRADGFIRCMKVRVLLVGVTEEYTKENGRIT